MGFGFKYDQLTPVANGVASGVIAFNPDNPEHREPFRKAIPKFLGSLGSVHGAIFQQHQLDAVMDVFDQRIMDANLLQASLGPDYPVVNAALATGAPDFGVEWDIHNKLKIYPVYHGEDLCVDKDIAALFREYTKCLLYPDGIGLGTWFMCEQIRQSIDNDDWIFAGRDNEHFSGNAPICGVMNKFGAIHGTEQDSAVLQIHGLTPSMEKRFGVTVEKRNLPRYANGLGVCPNNFLVSWSSKDGHEQIAITFRRLASTFDAEPVVWAKIKSNGHLPDNPMLKEVLFSLLAEGIAEIKSPARLWGVPLSKLKGENGLFHIFGGPMPVMHIHANNEKDIIQALLEMAAEHRIFGHEKMVSGLIDLRNMHNPIAIFGRPLPLPTEVVAIDPERDAHKPYFDVVAETKPDIDWFSLPKRPPMSNASADNDNIAALAVA